MRSSALVLGAAAALVSGAELRGVQDAPGLKGRCQSKVVEGEFLIKLKESVSDAAHSSLKEKVKARKSFKIGSRFRALHAALSKSELDWVLAQDEVAYVTHNMVASIADEKVAPMNVTWSRKGKGNCPDVQSEPLSWGQKRVTTQSAADVASEYAHDATWGAGVDVYVLDTGVRITHEEFEGSRAKWGANFAGGADTDNNGHGTHCAGTIAGKTYGVAKGATVVGVKVLGDSGSGSYDGIISGIEWAVSESKKNGRRGIGNMSLGGGKNDALNDAVNAAAAEGFLFSNAAGNCAIPGLPFFGDACTTSPASAEDGICVGSTELASQGGAQVDAKSGFSNFGSCVDVFAPGSSIVAAYAGGDSAYATLSGTSMAAPHVAGVGAVVLQQHPTFTAAQVSAEITSTAMEGLIQGDIGAGSPNKMLHIRC
eukprot:TRINITY_DN276_c0_g1_i2.p1 TRINITY_DN276_c0_g1~~TRINITY_DN276_c0_g1_i2.p1  ORF type:complete len:426 (+),score=150.90 TRINITY_DN276_c0_g1_i2:95-1372(+)